MAAFPSATPTATSPSGVSATLCVDPPISQEATLWVVENKPELGEAGGPCEGLFDGGPTPGECAEAVIAGFEEFMNSNT